MQRKPHSRWEISITGAICGWGMPEAPLKNTGNSLFSILRSWLIVPLEHIHDIYSDVILTVLPERETGCCCSNADIALWSICAGAGDTRGCVGEKQCLIKQNSALYTLILCTWCSVTIPCSLPESIPWQSAFIFDDIFRGAALSGGQVILTITGILVNHWWNYNQWLRLTMSFPYDIRHFWMAIVE